MAADREPEQAPPERIKPFGNMCGATATGRRRRGSPAGRPCLNRRLLRIRPRPHSVSDSQPNIRAPRTFPELNEPCDSPRRDHG